MRFAHPLAEAPAREGMVGRDVVVAALRRRAAAPLVLALAARWSPSADAG